MHSAPTSPIDAEGDGRKRVGKACDRCRIKKSKVTHGIAPPVTHLPLTSPGVKCDGKRPCGRCQNDDAVCVFGGRKRKHDRVHPKGYVEILERQQKQLVKGIRAIYDRQLGGQPWTGPVPQEGYPSTHDILDYLGALEVEDSSEDEACDDEFQFNASVHDSRQSFANQEDDWTQAPTSAVSLPPPARPRVWREHHQNYFSNKQPISMSPLSTPPTLSPSAQTSGTSPTLSTTPEHWTSRDWLEPFLEQQIQPDPLSKSHPLPKGPSVYYGTGYESATQNMFDPYLVSPWQLDEEFSAFAYTSRTKP
ncbi:MAG: hypothetical protein Q9163_006398 [Psora crenata]